MSPLLLERSSVKNLREGNHWPSWAIGTLSIVSIPWGEGCYVSLGDWALWDSVEGMHPQQMRQRAFWISWFLKECMTGLPMEFHQPAHCTRILCTAGECLSGGPNAGLRDPPNTIRDWEVLSVWRLLRKCRDLSCDPHHSHRKLVWSCALDTKSAGALFSLGFCFGFLPHQLLPWVPVTHRDKHKQSQPSVHTKFGCEITETHNRHLKKLKTLFWRQIWVFMAP